MNSELIKSIKEIITPVIESKGLEVFGVEFGYEEGVRILRVYIDKSQGISIKDCEDVSIVLSAVLDANDIIKEQYYLEVSSPGLYRELRNEKDFIRFLGSRIKVKTRELVENQKVFVGKLVEYKNGIIKILLENNKTVLLEITNIVKANLYPDDKDLFKKE